MTDPQVLIAGAGPTGLVLALWLAKQGVSVRLIDRSAEPGTTSRALAVHARTLELYRQLDLAEAVLEKGHKVPAVQLWTEGERRTRVSFEQVGHDLTPYPFLHIYPQDEHERLLIARLAELGVTVERRTELISFVQDGEAVQCRLRGPEGAETACEAAYLAGCDGARSTVRQGLGTGFPGGTYDQVFYVADVDASGPAINGELCVDLDEADFLAVFPLAPSRRARLIGTVREGEVRDLDRLKFEDVKSRAIHNLKVEVDRVNWFSTYHVHHRVTEHFRKGRAILLGDAAHIHSPAGGQGMNTGIGDAINLAWKLAAVLKGRAPEGLLDSYEAERIAFARRLVRTTDQAFSLATAEGWLADVVRTRLAPIVLPAATSFEAVRDYMFRTVSQITLNYRELGISEGKAGHVHGGDRLPWVTAAGGDNHAPLAAIGWQAHAYGQPATGLEAWCHARGLPLHVFAWTPAHEHAGLAQGAAYLIRPDTYVALAEPSGSPAVLEGYLKDYGFRVA
jgi:2-polyprenyl-6-methoxyphenol hydroxylase-like FAD-dependent oxidoreductase